MHFMHPQARRPSAMTTASASSVCQSVIFVIICDHIAQVLFISDHECYKWVFDWLIDWLVHLYPPITRKRRCAMFWTNPHPLRSWPCSKLSYWRFDFFPRKFAACLKPPSRDNHRKASYPRTQQRDQGAGWTHDPAIRVVVKTTPLPIRPRLYPFGHVL